ncbi:hypothetical protein DZC30_19100 [Comamonas testosteroni]|uniref:DZANK-type domain-containing protein n=1 Tax=Comamonas testosteroni TaxID=285 RepID=A0A373FAK7_COMTE|nr:zinc ribbon domain-containing protein [Comamonas testosteroni]RGE41178.1 hypothetical protein DZC30_19100 [Comamonas testosteroni]
MNCSQCGNALAANAKFCNRCGSRQNLPSTVAEAAVTAAPASAATEKICPQCQAVCKPQAKFCPKCGSSFPAMTDGANPAPTAALSPSALPSATVTTAASAALQVAATTAAITAPPAEPAKDAAAAPVTAPAPIPLPTPAPALNTQPPRIEPMLAAPEPAARPVNAMPSDMGTINAAPPPPPFLSNAPPSYSNAPALLQEPPRSSQAWIKWMVLALIVAAIGGGVLLARNMGALSSLNSPSVSPSDRNGVSDADKSKADNVVGPQGVGGSSSAATPASDPSVVTIPAPVATTPIDAPAPVTQVAPAVSAPPEPPPPLKLPQIQSNAGSGTESGPTPPNPAPKPAKPRPPARSGGPSLDDLLD